MVCRYEAAAAPAATVGEWSSEAFGTIHSAVQSRAVVDPMLSSVLGLPAEDWTAIATWVTAAIALAAAAAALRQVREARRLREEQAQPYVVVYLEETNVHYFVDLVIKNLGTTAATDITVMLDPPPERAIQRNKPDTTFSPLVPDELSVLVPSQEWRTLFDMTRRRGDYPDLPRRYTATVRYKDSHRRQAFEFAYALDWDLIINRASVTEFGMHELSKAASEIRDQLNRWNVHGRGLGVSIAPDTSSNAPASRASRVRNRLRTLVGLQSIGAHGWVDEQWWGLAAQKKRGRRARIGQSTAGRLLQQILK